ncbi:MAG TPA: serine hydrolase domain-containing protein [Cyclobacteriaceae bacterium]|nr:serine hydrolase domain-containing protein [Cyclobacteriaceae bacterium]
MKKIAQQILIYTLVSILFTGCGQAVKNSETNFRLSPGQPEAVGMSEERLAKIDGLIAEYMDKGWIPGAVALVARKGNIVYHKSFGFRDMEDGDTLRTDDIFRIASMTKAITSTAAMMLFEDGKFLLDDPVSKYIPAFRDPKILVSSMPDGNFTSRKAEGEVTIRQLLTHTSGIGYGFSDPILKEIYAKVNIPDGFVITNTTLSAAMDSMGRMPLLFEPGERFHYGLNTDVLGRLIEVVSGKSLDEFFRERIFTPLEMDNTHFFLPESKNDRLTVVYAESETGISPSADRSYDYPVAGEKKYLSGGAGLCSTALDYTRFLQLFVNEGKYNGRQLLSPKTIELIRRNQVGDMFGKNGFGLGFGLLSNEGAAFSLGSVGNMWWGGYFHTHFWIDPEEDLIGVLLLQMYPVIHDDIAEKFQVLVYQAVTE